MADITVLMLLAQVAMHTTIALRIVMWSGDGYRFRPWVSRIAWLMAGSSASSAMYILMAMPSLSVENANPWNTVFIFVVMVGVIKCRGNLGRFLTR